MGSIDVINQVISSVESHTKKPENFLSVQDKVALNLKKTTKCLYDFMKEECPRKSNALPELLIDGFDEEQIWQQLEIQNEGEFNYFLTGVSRVLAGSNKLVLPLSVKKPKKTTLEDETKENVGDDEKIYSQTEGEHEEQDEGNEDDEDEDDEDDDDDDINYNFDEDDDEKEHQSKKTKTIQKRSKKPSIVDDKFFKLNDMDEFLTEMEKEPKAKNAQADDSDEESVDYFNENDDDDEDLDDESNDEEVAKARMLKYSGFFDGPDDEAPVEEDTSDKRKRKMESNEPGSKKKRVKFNLENDDDEEEDEINEMEDDENESDDKPKSTLETRQERLKKRIEQLETQAISDKPWQLKGEISGTNRPQNSLLEEYVDFDRTTRPAPVITEETTLKLEDIIKQRIKDKAWDDVEKKFKPVDTPMEYKKKLIMDQEKSQKSLSQIYEDAYMKQKEALNPESEERQEEEPKEHKEIRQLMHKLMRKLDALSNFHYTPKMAKPEIKIISNVPAINMEEVAPVAASDAALLAPEEIKAKSRGDLIGESERTKTDMKRARRKKKVMQREKQIAKEKKEKEKATLSEKLKKRNESLPVSKSVNRKK